MESELSGTILVVDDDILHVEIVSAMLDSQYRIHFATDGEQAQGLAETVLPDLILLDVMMPGIGGYELCRRLKANARTASIPVIFVTAMGDVAAETRGLEAGAVDYIAKPISPVILGMRVRIHVELKQLRDRLEQLAVTDGLTQLANRRHFDERLNEEIERRRRAGNALSLMLLDVDFFKKFNDTYGHIGGDKCLRQVAVAFDRVLSRAPDFAARYGGEEFAGILPDTDHVGAAAIAERVRAAVFDLAIPHAASAAAPCVTVSVGVVTLEHSILRSAESLIRLADEQLYRAKQDGRNRVFCVAHSGAPNDPASED